MAIKRFLFAVIVQLVGGAVLGKLAPAKDPKVRAWLSSILGFLSVAIIALDHTPIFLVLSITSFGVLKAAFKLFGPKAGAAVVITYAWAAVSFLRLFTRLGRLSIDEVSDCAFLIFLLRLTAFAFTASDVASSNVKNEPERSTAEIATTNKTASQCDSIPYDFGLQHYLHYILFLPGVWSGPWLPCNTVHRTLSSIQPLDWPAINRFCKRRLCTYHPIALFILGSVLNIDFDIWTPEFFQSGTGIAGFQRRILWAHLFFEWKRSRLVTVWVLTELASAFAGVGSARHDDNPTTRVEIDDSEIIQVHNTRYHFSPSLRLLVRTWNCTIQRWLALFVHKRAPRTWAPTIRRLTVLLVSALWHGVNLRAAASAVIVSVFFGVEPFLQRLCIDSFAKPITPWGRVLQSLCKAMLCKMLIDLGVVPFWSPNWTIAILVLRKTCLMGLPFLLILLPIVITAGRVVEYCFDAVCKSRFPSALEVAHRWGTAVEEFITPDVILNVKSKDH